MQWLIALALDCFLFNSSKGHIKKIKLFPLNKNLSAKILSSLKTTNTYNSYYKSPIKDDCWKFKLKLYGQNIKIFTDATNNCLTTSPFFGGQKPFESCFSSTRCVGNTSIHPYIYMAVHYHVPTSIADMYDFSFRSLSLKVNQRPTWVNDDPWGNYTLHAYLGQQSSWVKKRYKKKKKPRSRKKHGTFCFLIINGGTSNRSSFQTLTLEGKNS